MKKTGGKIKKRPKFKTESPPPVLNGARLLAFADVDRSVDFKDRGSLLVDGRPLGKVSRLAIGEADDRAILLMFCDKKWTPLGIVECQSLVEAKRRAELDYAGISRNWIKATVTKRAARQYLERLYRDQRCSFCGRPPPDVAQMINARDARICNLCIEDFAKSVSANDKPP